MNYNSRLPVMVNIVKKTLLVSVMALSFTQAYAATDYEIRMPSGADTVVAAEAEPAVVADGATNDGTVSTVPVLTTASGRVASSTSHVSYGDWGVFNGQGTAGEWGWLSAPNETTGWVSYEFDTAVTINKYAIYGLSAAGSPALPKDFSLQGSHDGVTWVVLGSEVNATVTDNVFNYFTVVNSTAYLHYKLDVTKNQGDGTGVYVGFTELKLISAAPF